jgi:hypothetical protein
VVVAVRKVVVTSVVYTVANAVEIIVVVVKLVAVLALCPSTGRVTVERDLVTCWVDEPTKYPVPALPMISTISRAMTISYLMAENCGLGWIYA